MTKKALEKFFSSIAKCHTEEDVKNAYARYFKIEYNTAHKHDLFTPHVFFEFKYNKNFQNLKTRATVLAQCMYYVRRLKFGTFADMPVPFYLCMADQNEAILTETKQWGHFYNDTDGKYDWDLAPSTPDANLIDDLASTPAVRNMHIYNVADPTGFSVFSNQMEIRLNPQQLLFGDRKLVTEENFENVFKYWNDEFGEAVRNGFKTSRYFVADIQEGRSIFFRDQNKVHFNIGNGVWKEKKIMAPGYEHFWSIYDKVHDADVVRGVLAKIDRLTDEELRRFYGEFFTPLKFAKKALDYIEATVGKEWWKTGEYRLWDMAAGTGNLEYHLPFDALQHCYLSTIYNEDVEHCRRLFPTARVFQYDYLNDDVENLFGGETSLPFEFS